MSRIPLTFRMLLLLPLLAAGIDLTRATAACGAQAQTCLEAAGRGWLGPFAVVLVLLYAAAGGVLLARMARGGANGGRPPGFLSLWGLGTGGLIAVTTGQDLVARTLGGTDAALGGNPLLVLALCVVAGALLALVMRVAGEVADLIVLKAPRARRAAAPAVVVARRGADAPPPHIVRRSRGRAPPRS